VEDKGLAHLKDLTQLRELRLVQTKVRGPGLAAFVNLRALDLGKTPFGDDGTQYLRGMAHLRRLSLRDTLVTHAGLKNLAGLKELESPVAALTRILPPGRVGGWKRGQLSVPELDQTGAAFRRERGPPSRRGSIMIHVPTDQAARLAAIEQMEFDSVETHLSAAGAQPQVTIRRLRNAQHAAIGQAPLRCQGSRSY
jgi:hypothetical protein